MNSKMTKLQEAFDLWCRRRGLAYDIVMDEDDLQGYMIFKRNRSSIPGLVSYLERLVLDEGLYVKAIDTRDGTVLAFSIKAMSEDMLRSYLDESPFAAKIADIFNENQYTSADKRSTYARNAYTKYDPKNTPSKPAKKKPSVEPAVSEDLSGMAAKFQPADVLKRFDAAMKTLDLHTALKNSNIVNRLSDDRQMLVFLVKDAGGTLRPICQYTLVELGEANKMKEALDHLVDLSKKEAPGAGEKKRELFQSQEKALRDISKQYAMPDPNEQQAQQGNAPVLPQPVPTQEVPDAAVHSPAQGAPAQGAPAQDVPDQAAQGKPAPQAPVKQKGAQPQVEYRERVANAFA